MFLVREKHIPGRIFPVTSEQMQLWRFTRNITDPACGAVVQSHRTVCLQDMLPDNEKYVVVPKAAAHVWRTFMFDLMSGVSS